MDQKLMKIQLNKKILSICLFAFIFLTQNYCFTYENGVYKLELNEKSSRFILYKKNAEGEFKSISASDPRTSTFSIYENNGFYALGDSFRYRKTFEELGNGGIFNWNSKELYIKQTYTLDEEGFLEIAFSITNISSSPKSVGMKFVLDTDFENEDYFYVMENGSGSNIEKEYEITNPGESTYWTSGARNSKGSAIMGIPADTPPSKIIFGNWEHLDDADFYYKTIIGRDFNKPPYSINDSSVLYFYSPRDLLPQNSLKIVYLFRAISTVDDLNQLVFEKRAEPEPEVNIISLPEIEPEEDIIEEEEVVVIESESDPEPEPVIEEVIEEEVVEIPVEITEPEIILEEEPVIVIEEPEVFIKPEETVKEMYTEQLDALDDIQEIINTISRPGIVITEDELSQLENRITNLEEIDINEN